MAQFKYKSTYPNDIQDVTLSKYNSELSNIGFKYGTDKCWVNANHKNYLCEDFMFHHNALQHEYQFRILDEELVKYRTNSSVEN